MLQQRVSGILLPIASLPGKDIGNFGSVSFRFLKECVASGQRVWQVLPIGPTIVHDSPFYSPSAFAIGHNYIDVEGLADFGFLTRDEVADYFRKFDGEHPNRINYGLLWEQKIPLLRKAHSRFVEQGEKHCAAYRQFLLEESHWLDDYAEFMAIKEIHLGKPGKETWSQWDPEFKDRHAFQERLAEFRHITRAEEDADPAQWPERQLSVYREIEKQADFHRFLQWTTFGQWRKLKREAGQNDIHIIGDCPIYVAPDSADVWANREAFKLDENGDQSCYAGVPPDYFSPKYGQFWGNPIYRWFVDEDNRQINDKTLDWWARRLKHQFELFDEVRIDHFRGFAGYWEIPRDRCETADEKGEPVKTAKHGKWLPGPGAKLFAYVAGQLRKTERELPIIAEDLGVITAEVTDLRELLEAPGMGVFQFAPWGDLYCRNGGEFSEWSGESQYQTALGEPAFWEKLYYRGGNKKYLPFLGHEFLPCNALETGKLVFYPGTHDNETLMGWYENPDRTSLEKKMFLEYLDQNLRRLFADDERLEFYLGQPIHWKVIRLISASSDVRYTITQMQDVLGLPNEDAAAEIRIRTNSPNHTGQWQWKMGGEHEFTEPVREMLASITAQNHRK